MIEYKEHINITARVLNETMLKEAQEQSAALQQAVLRLELEKTNDLHRLILDAAGDGIYGLDTNGLKTFANPSALSMKKCLH